MDELFLMYYEEIADIANYGQMLFNKLKMIEMHLRNGGFIPSLQEETSDEGRTHPAA